MVKNIICDIDSIATRLREYTTEKKTTGFSEKI